MRRTKQSIKKVGILERLGKGIVVGAEGYVFELERRGHIKAGPFVPEVVLDYPQAVELLHREFLRAGAEVMVALTYYAHRSKLRAVGRERELEKLNRQAVRLAKKVAREGDVLVAGNICNTWLYDANNQKKTARLVKEMYREQLGWAVDEGIDFVIAETHEYVGEALIALEAIKEYKLPAMITFAATYEKSKEGIPWEKACKILESYGADIVGFNCARGPNTMLPLLKKLRKEVSCFVAAQPVPYRTSRKFPVYQLLRQKDGRRAFPIALEAYLHSREEMAVFAKEAKKLGINYIGICCGGAPYYVRTIAEALGRKVPSSKYSPDMSRHPMFGSKKVVRKQESIFLKHFQN